MGLFVGDRFEGSDDVFEVGYLPQDALGRHPVVLGHRLDEIALVGFEGGQEGVELLKNRAAVVAMLALYILSGRLTLQAD